MAARSWISICSGTRLNNRYIHTAYFENRAEQSAWFLSKVVKDFNGYTYLRKNWSIDVQATMEEANAWDYLYFANPYPANGGGYHTGRIYYYFINNIQYKNENTVTLDIELDVMQTYMFNPDGSRGFQMLPCYVDRMHTDDDTIGANTVDEGLALGEYVVNSEEHFENIEELCILVQATLDPGATTADLSVQALPFMYNNVFSGIRIYGVSTEPDMWAAWSNVLERLNEYGKIDCIVNMWMYPKNLVLLDGESSWDTTEDRTICKTIKGAGFEPFTMKKQTAEIDGYAPRNNKLFCYPFNMLYVTNNNGGCAVYRFERFAKAPNSDGSDIYFMAHGSLGADASVKLSPMYYNGDQDGWHEGLTLGGYPTCSWNSDTYKLWLAQNQNQMTLSQNTAGLKIAGGAVAGIAGLATGNLAVAAAGAGAAINGASQIFELNAQKADMEIVPPQARGSQSASLNVSYGLQTFTFQHRTIPAEYARRIDDFFTMFGYRLGRCITPKYNHRKSHVYIKTIDCKIAAAFCAEDSAKIEAIFDKGITFWRDPDGLGDYSRDNSII